MKLRRHHNAGGFSLGEMIIVVAMTTSLLAASFATLASLQKSFAAVDSYFSTHLQQIRIIDYLSRDIKRSTIVTTSSDLTTVTCTVPSYVIRLGDSDALANAANIGKRRTPGLTITPNGATVDYGRTVTNAIATEFSTNLTSATASFTAADVGKTLAAPTHLRPATTIVSVTNSTTVVMSRAAIITGGGVRLTIVSSPSTVVYSLNNQEIRRTEDGVQVTIARSTDSLVPETTDVELANTGYALTNVTFLPTFNFNNPDEAQTQAAKRDGTSVFALSYLRNKRRG